MLLLLDNYDSFTYNVYQLLCELGAEVEVIRNDKITVEQVAARKYDGIVISPGPGVPADSGITESLIDTMKGRVPILGICLGHQAIGEVFGGREAAEDHRCVHVDPLVRALGGEDDRNQKMER